MSGSSSRSPPIDLPTDTFWSSLQVEDQGESSTSRPDTPHIPQLSRSASYSRSDGVNTPRKGGNNGKMKKEKLEPFNPPTIGDLPNAWDEAHETFEVLERCVYESKKMGASREQDEMMVCDCVFDKRNHDAEQCGSHSDCVNRAIFIECLAHECRARDQCRNQRFTKRQFSNLEIVKTEMKGYGLRAGTDIASGNLIYEYIGEVIGETTFRKRMAGYGEEGIKHFYFMMLQKEEYIDATKKGGIGRFANHSCNPNCEVQKWVVGRRLRMGIFAKRDIHHNEEITFNYNVDRYGHEAQICYCGEPGCVGYIGGKTQTDIGGINDLFLDALGITDQVEAEEMKGSKKKKARHLDEDFTPDLKPIIEPEVQKVAAAIRQSMDNQKIMRMLLERVKMTEDDKIHRQLIRMHGLSLMYMILTELSEYRELVLLALQGMTRWKLQYRNKIADSNIEEPVKELQAGTDTELSEIAQTLLDQWTPLEFAHRIARVKKLTSLDAEDDANTQTLAEATTYSYSLEHRKPNAWENTSTVAFTEAPVIYRAPSSFVRPPLPPPTLSTPKVNQTVKERSKLEAIIASASVAAPVPATPTPQPESSPAESSRSGALREEGTYSAKRIKVSHGSSTYLSAEEEAARKEKRMMKLVGEVVVRSMSKYKEMMDHDTFKKYARDCTNTLVDKEKRSTSYTNHRKPTLNEEKKAKIKSFTKEFTHKLMKRLKEKGKLKKPRSSHHNSSSSVAPSTPTTTAPSTTLETPRTSAEADELDDIFGVDDPEEDSLELLEVVDGEDEKMDVDIKEEEEEEGPKGRMKLLEEARKRRESESIKVQPISVSTMMPVDTWQVGGGGGGGDGGGQQRKSSMTKVYVPIKEEINHGDQGKDTPIRTPSST